MDKRKPQYIPLLRRIGSEQLSEEGLGLVVFVYDVDRETGEEIPRAATMATRHGLWETHDISKLSPEEVQLLVDGALTSGCSFCGN